jgi:hypothetical protein
MNEQGRNVFQNQQHALLVLPPIPKTREAKPTGPHVGFAEKRLQNPEQSHYVTSNQRLNPKNKPKTKPKQSH